MKPTIKNNYMSHQDFKTIVFNSKVKKDLENKKLSSDKVATVASIIAKDKKIRELESENERF